MGNFNSKRKNEIIIIGYIEGKKKIPVIENKLKMDHSSSDIFKDKENIQDYLSKEKEECKDQSFQKLKEFESTELKKIFDDNYDKYITDFQKEKINLLWDKNLIEKIIENENSSIVYKRKIIDEILSIKNNDNSYQIKQLKILLVGRIGVGKTTLIKYMLNLDENKIINNNSFKNFVTYENKNVPYLKLVEFKGIGLDQNNDPEKVGQEALNYIQNEIKNNNKNGDYNDFFHCIWFCISFARFEESEKNLLIKLSQVYNDKTIPIIIVYTQNINNTISNSMEIYIKEKIGIKTSFIKVLAKDMNVIQSRNIRKAFGKSDLLNLTLKKCTMALQGDMINFMIDTISDDVKGKILAKNKSLEKMINDNIIKKYINEYKCVLSDEGLKNYITEMIGNNLFSFYEKYNRKITNKTLNYLKKSNIINSIDDFIRIYKTKVFYIIEENQKEKAKMFIDKQAEIEKVTVNIRLENKRYLKGFEKSIISFIKRNFYYISQKIIINYMIKNFFWSIL